MKFKLTFWKAVFMAIMGLGVCSTLVRFFNGLGAVSNMSDEFPWGVWIGFDLLCGVMLAAGSFCVIGAVYLFNVERLHSVVRPAVLTAFLGYSLFIVGLLFDLGRPWYIWHQMIYMNPHSVMFEVGICVMSYTTVLFFEFLPNVFERFKLKAPIRWIKKIYPALIILGILLSTLHQSSLGSLFLIMPSKLHPFWYTPALPFLFFGSAVAVGLAMTIFEFDAKRQSLRAPSGSRGAGGTGRRFAGRAVDQCAAALRGLLASGPAAANRYPELRIVLSVARTDAGIRDSDQLAQLQKSQDVAKRLVFRLHLHGAWIHHQPPQRQSHRL